MRVTGQLSRTDLPKQQKSQPAEDAPGEESAGEARSIPATMRVALDAESRSAIEKLTSSVETLVANLTKAGAVATGADVESDEPSHEPAGPKEDNFMERVVRGARKALVGEDSEQN